MAKPQEDIVDTQADDALSEDALADEAVQAEQAEMDPLAVLAEVQAEFEEERTQMRDRLMRALADLENSRKRGEKDRREAALYGGTKLARDLLPVYDNLNRALELVDEDTKSRSKGLVEGLELTLRELVNIFARHGIEKLAPEIGEEFDPHLHEAMFEAPVPDTKAGQIIQVLNVGFRLHEQLLRPAQVGVSSTPAG
ncbi:nucleotide exchange factor GrpE [Pararhodobacter oceanensis]|uniref:Protein GrpE n=1 Tax=Pararhodobacter oceanensis TaxID=2172121 RepID=A0A2T8HSD6_9RHOB|nr:nucleotide exchange factor GrpE [Pararhodobacter oceanensis]PVH28358.1 nucleotide exchange factor GrpE [Pararhodobacter oceanensis]